MPVVHPSEIDLRLFAQIQNDPFLTGTYNLQGETFARSISYLFQYVDKHPDGLDILKKLKPALSYLADIEKKMVPGAESTRNVQKLFDLAQDITQDLQKLDIGESIAIPGGWLNRLGLGHAMIYEWTRTETGLELSIFNAGAGAQYHELRSAKDRELFYPIQTYQITLPQGFDDKTIQRLNYYLNALLIARTPSLRKDKAEIYFDEKKLYEEVIPGIYYLDAKLISAEKKGAHTLTGGQLSGTCAVRCLLQMIKANSSSIEAYQRWVYDFKRYALDDFMNVLRRSGKTSNQEEVLVKQAINTLKRILNLSERFQEEFITEQVTQLNQYLEELKTLGDISVLQPRSEAKGDIQETDADLKIGPIPMALVPLQKQQAPKKSLSFDTLGPIHGGADLFKQLKDLEFKIKQLRANGDYQAVIEGLETIFVNFPLSSEEKDYYQAINQENQTQFYQAMNRLHRLYVSSIHALAKDAALPRMWAVSLSIISILDRVSKPLSWGKGSDPTFQGFMSVSCLSLYNRNNPFLATNNPILDARIIEIQQRYQHLYQSRPRYSDEYTDLDKSMARYYQSILASEPGFNEQSKNDFHSRFPWHTDRKFGNELVSRGLQALYILSLDYRRLRGQPIYKKFEAAFALEECAFNAVKTLNHDLVKPEQPLKIFHEGMLVSYLTEFISQGLLDDRMKKHKYDLPKDSVAYRALDFDFNRYFEDDVHENEVQLSPCQLFQQPLDALSRQALARHVIDQEAIKDREYFHLRGSPLNQIKLTLDYYLLHLDQLSSRACQRYLEANLFQPGLFIQELKHGDGILNQMETFIHAGLKHFSKQGMVLSEESLFFLDLSFLVYRYAAEYQSDRYLAKLEQFQKQLTAYLEIAEADQVEIRRHLHQLRYRTAIACFKLQPKNVEILVQTIVPSFFYMNAQGHPKHENDLATEFELACHRFEFKKCIASCSQERLLEALREVVIVLDLGTLLSLDKKTDTIYQILLNREGQRSLLQVDIENGLIFNEQGMAYTPMPLSISHHPVIDALKIGISGPCTKSIDDLVYELGDPVVLRWIRSSHDEAFRVQKLWTVEGVSAWYELHAFNLQQQRQLGLSTPPISILVPDTHQERDAHLWVRCEHPKAILITENNQPAFISDELTSRTCQLKPLNAQAMATDFKILNLEKVNWIYDQFDSFEDRRFITILGKQGFLEIHFDRYGLTLRAEQQGETWHFYKKDSSSQRLITAQAEKMLGVCWLIFEDESNQQRHGYIPRQPFIEINAPSPHSEFYRFSQDIHAMVPEQMVKESIHGDMEQLQAWQFTGSEQVMCFRFDEHGQPYADTPEQALFLCYLYLGCHQPAKAWAILDDCFKRLGGLKGTIDELRMLFWIVNGLPKKIDTWVTSEATISTPSYVACKLKALALLTSVMPPHHVISMPNQTFNLQTPEGRYQQACWKELRAFRDQLHQTIFSLFSTRFQLMQRHSTHSFLLRDDEKKSLLDFYHAYLTGDENKAIGSLGYEWQRLELMNLNKERNVLLSQKSHSSNFPPAYQKRLSEIDTFLSQERFVRAHHTELMPCRINMSIPSSMSFSLYQVTSDLDVNRSWLNIQDCRRSASQAIRSLRPELTELEMVYDFPIFCKIAGSQSNTREKAILVDFCRRYLMTHYRVPLEKQANQLGFLIQLLYRIGQNPDEMRGKSFNSCYEWIQFARTLPEPIIEIIQPVDCKQSILAKQQEIWQSIHHEIPLQADSMVAQSLCPLDEFKTLQLLKHCKLDSVLKDELFQCFQDYQQHAAIFYAQRGQEDPSEKDQVLTSQELKIGKIQIDAWRAMQQIAYRIFSNSEISKALYQKTQQAIEELESMRQAFRSNFLTLANSGPADRTQRRYRLLDIEGQVRAPWDEAQLLALYLKADKTQYQLATGLNDTDIEALHTQISHYVASTVRQQHLQRFLAYRSSQDDTPDMTTCQLLAEAIFTENGVNERSEYALNLFQLHENITLRPQQIAAIQRLSHHSKESFSYDDLIEKIVMGGGKSKVILPLLAFLKASGSNLMVIEVPQPLFETNSTDLDQTSRRLFNQKVCRFEFNRDTDCSSKNLSMRYQQLLDVIASRDYLVTTGEAIQSIELKYFELLLARPSEEQYQEEWKQQITWMDKLLDLFHQRADVVIDEVHRGLLLKKKLNYTLGCQRSISPHLAHACVDLYSFFEQVSLGDIFGVRAPIKTLASLLENEKLSHKALPWRRIMDKLGDALVYQSDSPLQLILSQIYPQFSSDEQKELLGYIKNQGETIPDCVLRCDAKTRDLFALYKEQISQLLTSTLARKLHVDYGPSYLQSRDGVSASLAIPYAGNRIPLERCRFGNVIESMNLTIQMLMIDGFQPTLLKHYLAHLQSQARQELLRNPSLGTLSDTSVAKDLADCAPLLRLSLGEIDLRNEHQFSQQVFNTLRKNKTLIQNILKTEILKEIQIDEGILHSDAFNHVDLYRSCQGITGTPSNHRTYHQRLRYNKQQVVASDGLILQRLREKKTRVRQINFPSMEVLITELFKGKQASDFVRAIIDICACFKGIRNLDVAKALAHYIHEHPGQFDAPARLKYILFFDDSNQLCALDIEKPDTIILIGSTNPKEINQKLGCTPDERLSYYDQSHTIGADLKHFRKAQALVLVDEDTTLQSYLQGSMRMRDLAHDQSIEVIACSMREALSQEALQEHFAENEDRQLKQDVFFAGQAKMVNLIRSDLKQRILKFDHHEIEIKHRYAHAMETFLLEKSADHFFAIYGGLSALRPAQEILNEKKYQLLTEWAKILRNLNEEESVIVATQDKLLRKLDEIIQETLQYSESTYLDVKGQALGTQVEVQKETMKEIQKELQQELQCYQPSFNARPYINMYDRSVLDKDFSQRNHFQSLTEICALSSKQPVPDFDDIYVGKNYYETYQAQKVFVGVYLKPVHAILFRKRPGCRLESVLLSPEDSERVSLILAQRPHPYVWIGTTQHTILAGQVPQGVVESIPYQEIIEKIRFFNGELPLLMMDKAPMTWLGRETDQKLAYYEHHLLSCRETLSSDLAQLRQSVISPFSKALRYFVTHPFEDYAHVDWRQKIDPLLTFDEINECKELAKAFLDAIEHGFEDDFCFEACRNKFQSLSEASLAHLARLVYGQLLPLRECLSGLSHASKEQVKPLLPMLFREYLPHSQEQTLLVFLMQKLSVEGLDPSLMKLLYQLHPQPSAESVKLWMLHLGQVLESKAPHAIELANRLFSDVLTDVRYQLYWKEASKESFLRFVECPVLLENNNFLCDYLFAFYKDETNLKRLIQCCETNQRWQALERILQKTRRPFALLLERLKQYPQAFLQSIASIEEWIQSPFRIVFEDESCLGTFLEQVIQENRVDATLFLDVLQLEITRHSEIYVHQIIAVLKQNKFDRPSIELFQSLFEHSQITAKGKKELIDHFITLEPEVLLQVLQSIGIHRLLELKHKDLDFRLVQIKNLPLPFIDALLNHELDEMVLNELMTCQAFGPSQLIKVLRNDGHILRANQVIDMMGWLQRKPKGEVSLELLRELFILMLELPCSNPTILKIIVAFTVNYLPEHIPFWAQIPSKFNTLDLSDINLSKQAETILFDLKTLPKSMTRLDLTNSDLGSLSRYHFISTIPMHVMEFADNHHQFLPRPIFPPWCTFVFRALEIFAAISGIALLIAGAIFVNPMMIGGGASIVAGLITTESYCFFSKKKSMKPIEPIEVNLEPTVG